MTRAKDISKIITDADFSGTLDVTGTVTAGGLTVNGDGSLNGTAVNLIFNETDTTDLNTRFRQSGALFSISTVNDSGSSPKAHLVVNNSTGDISFYEDTGTTPKLFWDASAERLGIGTSSPSHELTVAGSTDTRVTIDGSNSAGLYISDSGANGITIRNTNNGDLEFLTVGGKEVVFNQLSADTDFRVESDNNTHALFVQGSNGNVGIGTSSPVASSLLTLKETNAGGDGAELRLINSSTTVESATQIVFTNTTTDTADSAVIKAVRTASGQDFRFSSDGSERMRINGSGNVGIGTTSPSGAAGTTLAINGGSGQSRLALKNTNTGDASGDGFQLSVGTDGSVGIEQRENNYMALYTNATERMRISSDGRIGMGNSNPNSARLHINQNAVNEQGINLSLDSGSYTNIGMLIQAAKGQASDFFFHQCKSNNGADTEFSLRGDGQAYADGSWNGGGADYAEYFEWADGNTDSEDRRGYTVVLENNKIRKATSDDDASIIVGVISGNPSMVGDSDIGQWKHKYQRDDYGTYIRDESGNRVLNTDYDGSQEYVSRENRQEWDTVGLMGKLRIRKNQPTGSNWIKMRDISETVEEWLVR